MKVAIVGSGIAGLAAAHTLLNESGGKVQLTLFEAGHYFGGHTHTVNVTLPTAQGPVTHGVDTGFLVLNERTYPELIALFKALDVPLAKSDMSFSVQALQAEGARALEWSGTSLSSVFAQRRNLLNPVFLGMLADLLRFNRLATHLAMRLDATESDAETRQPLRDFLREHRFGKAFCDWYFLPMMACIWSCPTQQMLEFPVATMLRFCHNHGLLQISQRPQWWTVAGGARHYVDKITAQIEDKRLNTAVRQITRLPGAGIQVATATGHETFAKVILATHSDQALALLHAPSTMEKRTLGAINYQPNRAVLHTDTSALPVRQSAWAAWNYERAANPRARELAGEPAHVCLHYLINRLQPLPWAQPVVVSLNPQRAIDERQVLGEFDYAHPVFDLAAMKAQRQMPWLQGPHNTYYCGAWMGYGFHEDGLKAGVGAARHLLADLAQSERKAA